MGKQALLQKVDRQLNLVREEASGLVASGPLAAFHRDAFRGLGKLLRPRVLLLSVAHGEECGSHPDWDCARNAALAIELAHVGTLYHDDIVDRSETRRGELAVHALVGSRSAALAGAHLLTLANAYAARLPDPLVLHWSRAALQVADGQLREAECAGDLELRVSDYLRIARRKTAALFELASRLGAAIGSVSASHEEALIRFGSYLGLAFQLFDDLNDFAPEVGQRLAGNDLRERIYTCAALIGCSRIDEHGIRLRALLADDGRPLTDETTRAAYRILLDSGALAEASGAADLVRTEACQALESLGKGLVRTGLERLANSLGPPAERANREMDVGPR